MINGINNELNLFDVQYKDRFIFHIPHSSTYLPDIKHYSKGVIDNEINLLTDFATEEIFDIKNTSKLVANFSRIYCDVERFSDDNLEPMSKFGRGFYYTKTDSGELLRQDNKEHKQFVYDNFYKPHHDQLNSLVEDKLLLFDECIIIDCHSFSDIPFNSDLIKDTNRPDICIGTDDFHTPQHLIDLVRDAFIERGYTVSINNPYSGTMINSNSYKIDQRVKSIMIEVNRKLYMTNNVVDYNKVNDLNMIINDIFDY